MKRKLLIAFIAILATICCTFGLIACGGSNADNGGNTQTPDNAKKDAAIVSVEGATVDEKEMRVSMLVDKDTESVSLSNKVVCSKDSVWKLYYDKLGQTEIPTKIASGKSGALDSGDNTFYIVVTSSNGSYVNVYEMTVHRSHAIEVKFYNNKEQVIKTENAYSGFEYSLDYEPEISGYTFNYWEDENGKKITAVTSFEPLNFYANCTAKAYDVTFNADGGEAVSGSETVTYDKPFSFPATSRTGFVFKGWYYGDVQVTDGNGKSITHWAYPENVTLVAGWLANKFSVNATVNDENSGSVRVYYKDSGESEEDGKFDCGAQVTVEAVTNLGYTFIGIFNENGVKVNNDNSQSLDITVGTSEVSYTAKWDVSSEMLGLSFTSTPDTCTVTGVDDKTVTEVVLPDIVTSIGANAFAGCASLISINIPAGVTSIGKYAFYECTSLKAVTIPEGVTSIESRTFYHCRKLESVKIPDSLISIGDYAFYWCDLLESVRIPEGVTYIGENAFYNCKSIGSIVLYAGVTKISNYAFFGCVSLGSITIYCGDLTDVGNMSFGWCESLRHIYFKGTKSQWSAVKRGTDWNYKMSGYTIHCTDGNI